MHFSRPFLDLFRLFSGSAPFHRQSTVRLRTQAIQYRSIIQITNYVLCSVSDHYTLARFYCNISSATRSLHMYFSQSMRQFSVIALTILIGFFQASANNDSLKTYVPLRVAGEPPVMDGFIGNQEWPEQGWESGFVQHKPLEGKPASRQTSFNIMYDNDHLYVAFRIVEKEPDKISRRLSRRDEMEGDMVGIQIDSYFDRTTAFVFWVTAAGVKIDGVEVDGSNSEDMSWDALWTGKTAFDSLGWTVEMRIPLTQLRFSQAESHTWGLQVLRYIQRFDEVDIWQPIPRDASTWVSRFGLLEGLSGIEPKRQIEMMPYVVASIGRYKAETGNPFSTGKSSGMSAGLDGKIGLTNNMILDFTINPDFGQVEADPSEVNLTAYESYFAEKRPFFVEGRNILSFGVTPGDNDASSDNLFYSRRIGRAPHRDLSDYDYADAPANTTILGAFKVTGKTRNGWSVGLLESLTSLEKAEVIFSESREKVEVEPLTNYFIGRLQKDFNKGTTKLGGMFTAVNRNIDDAALNNLHKSAYTGGLDFNHTWNDRTYYLNIKGIFSHVTGDSTAIKETQESSARYFQRPDASYVKYDPSRTSLSGHAGIVEFGKSGNGNWLYTTWINWRSPGFEINDAGFQRRSDDIFQVIWVGYRYYKPIGIFKEISFNFNQWSGWDFGLNNRYSGGNVNANTRFKNQWGFSFGVNRDFAQRSNYLLRGGPSILLPGGNSFWTSLSSDNSKKFNFGVNYQVFKGDEGINESEYTSLRLTWAPVNSLNISLTPFYSADKTMLQYVETADMQGDTRYVFATLDQQTFGLPIRINVGITPDLTVQYYGQPFISAGKYSRYKMITKPVAAEFNDRFLCYQDAQVGFNSQDEVYDIDEDLNGTTDYTFDKPDFNAFYFISNLVVRWEYLPGSSVYLVWSQNRSDSESIGTFRPGPDMEHLSTIFPHNVFLIKVSYRLGL